MTEISVRELEFQHKSTTLTFPLPDKACCIIDASLRNSNHLSIPSPVSKFLRDYKHLTMPVPMSKFLRDSKHLTMSVPMSKFLRDSKHLTMPVPMSKFGNHTQEGSRDTVSWEARLPT